MNKKTDETDFEKEGQEEPVEEEKADKEEPDKDTYEVEEIESSGTDMIELGGNITLRGFDRIDGGSMIILKKIIGNYARTLSDNLKGFEKVNVTLRSSGETYVAMAEVISNGRSTSSEESGRNLFFCVSRALEKVNSSLGSS